MTIIDTFTVPCHPEQAKRVEPLRVEQSERATARHEVPQGSIMENGELLSANVTFYMVFPRRSARLCERPSGFDYTPLCYAPLKMTRGDRVRIYKKGRRGVLYIVLD